jgi:16S rRNA (cytosine967-C5)-methyltransferase
MPIAWKAPLWVAEAKRPRLAAAGVIAKVLYQGRSLSALLPPVLASLSPTDRALAQELCYGTLRWQPRLEYLLARLMQKPLKARDNDLHTLLLVGLYQLGFLSMGAHAAVSETVAETEHMGKGWAKGLVNGILRTYQREQERLAKEIDKNEAARYAHPAWLVERIRAAWPHHWEAVLEANNRRPPFTLRVNQARITRESYLSKLQDAGLSAHASPHTSAAVTLEAPLPVDKLPGFSQGEVSVQDGAAQLAAELLDPREGEHILDACAAPGGKTGHLLERGGDIELEAIDRDEARLLRIHENLDRLGLSAQIRAADLGAPDQWWDGRPYDRVLLDAPCSATGVIRRHPDIKILRRQEDISALVTEQARLLDALWPLLRGGGMLLYATCSILPEENALQILQFLSRHADAEERPIEAAWGHAQSTGRQILPGEDDMDGFYYACIVKT